MRSNCRSKYWYAFFRFWCVVWRERRRWWDSSDLAVGEGTVLSEIVFGSDVTSDWLLFNELHDERDKLNPNERNFWMS